MKAFLRKLPGGMLLPDDDESAQALTKIKTGKVISCEFKQPRNYEFFKKWFKLLEIAFDIWTETMDPPLFQGQPVQPNKDKFRKDITILAGYRHPVVNINGDVRWEADSISFANMNEEDFHTLYSKTIDVILHKVLAGSGLTEEALRQRVEDVLRFDS